MGPLTLLYYKGAKLVHVKHDDESFQSKTKYTWMICSDNTHNLYLISALCSCSSELPFLFSVVINIESLRFLLSTTTANSHVLPQASRRNHQ